MKLKSYLKNTRLWIMISNSSTYLKFRNPSYYQELENEKIFYKEVLQKIQFNKDLIFDIGANLGEKSAIFSKLARNVIAFEPSEKLFIFLNKKFKNGNVKLFNCALGSDVSELDFYEVEGSEAHNSLSKKHIETTVTARNIATIDTVKHKKVQVDVVENFIAKFGVPVFIKIDVEGFEYEVIKGLKTPVSLISFEANLPEFCEESIQILEYLTNLSSGKYRFNFTTDNLFLKPEFVTKEEAINFLLTTKLRYLEIYAKLQSR